MGEGAGEGEGIFPWTGAEGAAGVSADPIVSVEEGMSWLVVPAGLAGAQAARRVDIVIKTIKVLICTSRSSFPVKGLRADINMGI